jgi:hypothetical protein
MQNAIEQLDVAPAQPEELSSDPAGAPARLMLLLVRPSVA